MHLNVQKQKKKVENRQLVCVPRVTFATKVFLLLQEDVEKNFIKIKDSLRCGSWSLEGWNFEAINHSGIYREFTEQKQIGENI